ncbi:MAG: fibronectin type III-like domain-contianing protein [Bacteroidales bacterium]|nr:fibronectin type III-like domain-contianing protein [Bacteroidales bacterium]
MSSGQPSGPGRVHPRSAAAEYGLSPEAAPERSEASKAGLASPDRGRPRHARGGTADEVGGGASRSEESGLPEPALDALAHVSINVTNEGPYDGAEVVQLYVRDEYASVTRPVKELKAFRRVFLKVGESAEVTFAITPEMLQCFGADNRWSVEPGEFTILIGSSSADQDLQKLSLTID